MFNLETQPLSQSESLQEEFLARKRKRTVAMSEEIIGKRFGKWTVVKRANKQGLHKSRLKHYLCACVCGYEKIIAGTKLRRNMTLQCRDCANKEHAKKHIGWNLRKTWANKKVVAVEIIDDKGF